MRQNGEALMFGKAKILTGVHKDGVFSVTSIHYGFINVLITNFKDCKPFEISYLHDEYEIV
jgi:hypothetical protein